MPTLLILHHQATKFVPKRPYKRLKITPLNGNSRNQGTGDIYEQGTAESAVFLFSERMPGPRYLKQTCPNHGSRAYLAYGQARAKHLSGNSNDGVVAELPKPGGRGVYMVQCLQDI